MSSQHHHHYVNIIVIQFFIIFCFSIISSTINLDVPCTTIYSLISVLCVRFLFAYNCTLRKRLFDDIVKVVPCFLSLYGNMVVNMLTKINGMTFLHGNNRVNE